VTKSSPRDASIRNPALQPFSALVGRWTTVGAHPQLPGTLHGQSSFEWIEGGAFVMMRSEIDEPGVPSGVAIFGSDHSTGEFFMLYFDERGVSRKYNVTLRDNLLHWWRNEPGFSQRFTGTISDDRRTIIGKGELSKDGATWEQDLDLTYTRAE
jgi:hypothetical protein